MKNFKYWFCNECDTWRDELTQEDIKTCYLDGDCVACECSSGYDSKEERENQDFDREDNFFEVGNAVTLQDLDVNNSEESTSMGCEWREICPHEDTERCKTCRKESDQTSEEMTFTYNFVVKEGASQIEGLHNDLDLMVNVGGLEVLKSTLESPDEISEHDFMEGEN